MADGIKHWLKEQLSQTFGVRHCMVDPAPGIVSRAYPADLRVLLWTGVVVHIYILHEPPKTRLVKQIIQHDTNHGIGAMFILNPALVPAPRARFVPPEWLMALHALNNERVYTHSPKDREMALLQIHFERLDATEQYETIYGPQVLLERLHYGRSAVKVRAVKGFWLTAHFGPAPFWQHQRSGFYMPPPRQSAPAGAHHNGHASADASQPAPPPKTRLETCYEILGVHSGATQEEVKVAFRRQVFNVHPDVSALPKVIAEEKFRLLAEAYEYIKDARGWL
jgi:DnaJ-domain-containing protein 1